MGHAVQCMCVALRGMCINGMLLHLKCPRCVEKLEEELVRLRAEVVKLQDQIGDMVREELNGPC